MQIWGGKCTVSNTLHMGASWDFYPLCPSLKQGSCHFTDFIVRESPKKNSIIVKMELNNLTTPNFDWSCRFFRNPEKGAFVRGALRKLIANSTPNLHNIAGFRFICHTRVRKIVINCRKFESQFRTVSCKYPFFQCPFLDISYFCGFHKGGVCMIGRLPMAMRLWTV